MKQLNKFLLLLLFSAGIFLTSCEEEEKLPNVITIDEEDIALENGYILGYGSDTDDNGEIVSDYRIVLTEAGIEANEGNFSGSGTAVFLNIISPVGYELKNGTYQFAFDEEYLKSEVYGYVYYNWDGVESVDEFFTIQSGTLNLTKSGKSFKIKISNLVLIRDSDGSEVEGKGSWEDQLDDKALAGSF